MLIPFETFSIQHFSALLIFLLVTFILIWLGQNSDERTKGFIGFAIAFFALTFMVLDSICKVFNHSFEVLDDLPLFLCDVVVIILPFVIWKKNRKWLGILYFWVMAGTLQALLTPELKEGFPSFEFFRYFIMHAGIVTAVIYSIVVWKIKIEWRDFFNAFLYVQFYIVSIHIINMIFGFNYSYTMKKPLNPTILDFMGEWPWYLLSGELLMIILFLGLMLPFLFTKRKMGSNTITDTSGIGKN
ncbi:MAG TPA: TIGR02206 family membrane protein [Saprospiraceae bacterium]|nr:TIGR02206 family membrane protein [Saprospiraceae bacterium]